MIIEPDNIEHQPSLIEDVVMPHAARFTDVSRDEVRRRAVGNLQRQYDRSRQTEPSGFRYTSSRRPAKRVPGAGFTVVPPLRSLPDPYSGTTAFLPPLVQLPGRLGNGLASRLRRAGGAIIAFLFGWLPKRYTAASGMTTDWDTAAYRTKIAVPAILILGVLTLLAYGIVTAPNRSGTGIQNTTPRGLPINVSNSSGRGSSGSAASTSKPSSQAASGSASTTAASGTASSTASPTGTLTGGMGGGPSGTTTLPLNLTTTVPPTGVQAGGKTLLDTSGTTLTVN